MTDQPLVQISSPIRQGDYPQVVVRVDSPEDVAIAEGTLNEITHRLAPLVKSTAQALADVPPETAQAISHMAQAGMNPQVVSPPPAQAPPAPQVSQCPACSKSTACPQCQGPTVHTTQYSKTKDQSYNVHKCQANARHTMVWCRTPIPKELMPVVNNPNLVYPAA